MLSPTAKRIRIDVGEESTREHKIQLGNTIASNPSIRCAADDFIIGKELDRGNYGVVYEAIRKIDSKRCAIKLFGYLTMKPDWKWIRDEIDNMLYSESAHRLLLLGVFIDPPAGIKIGKIYREEFPVIVMELLDLAGLYRNLTVKFKTVMESIDRNRLDICEKINEGSYGKVFAARDRVSGREVAIKFFGYTHQPPELKWIMKEIQVMALLKERGFTMAPNIFGVFVDKGTSVSISGAGTGAGAGAGAGPGLGVQLTVTKKLHAGSMPAIVMERLRGPDLCDKIVAGLRRSDIRTIFKNILEAVQSLHAIGRMVNCDLKPDNIVFVDEESTEIKIIDFGLALPIKVRSSSNSSNASTNSNTSVTIGGAGEDAFNRMSSSGSAGSGGGYESGCSPFRFLRSDSNTSATSEHSAGTLSSPLNAPLAVWDNNPYNIIYNANFRGTIGLIAPETLLSSPRKYEYSEKSDIWALGCILYVMFHARYPFGTSNECHSSNPDPSIRAMHPHQCRCCSKVTNGQKSIDLLQFSTEVTREWRDLIGRLLEKNPADRISIHDALLHPAVVPAAARPSAVTGKCTTAAAAISSTSMYTTIPTYSTTSSSSSKVLSPHGVDSGVGVSAVTVGAPVVPARAPASSRSLQASFSSNSSNASESESATVSASTAAYSPAFPSSRKKSEEVDKEVVVEEGQEGDDDQVLSSPEFVKNQRVMAFKQSLKASLKDKVVCGMLSKDRVRAQLIAHHGMLPEGMDISICQFKKVRTEFLKLASKHRTKTLNKTLFNAVLKAAQLTWLIIDGMFELFDTDNNGSVDYFELLVGLFVFRSDKTMFAASDDSNYTSTGTGTGSSTQHKLDDREMAAFYFEIFDVMGDGSISVEELIWVLAQFMVDSNASNEVFFRDLFEKLDVDGNGRIDQHEFINFYCQVSAAIGGSNRSTNSSISGLFENL